MFELDRSRSQKSIIFFAQTDSKETKEEFEIRNSNSKSSVFSRRKKHTPATLGHLEGICRSSRWLGQGLGEVAVGSVRVFRRPVGAAGPAPASRRKGRLDLRVTPVPAGRCGEGRGRKDARSAVLRDAHDAPPTIRNGLIANCWPRPQSPSFGCSWFARAPTAPGATATASQEPRLLPLPPLQWSARSSVGALARVRGEISARGRESRRASQP